jgi:hypothetical protein
MKLNELDTFPELGNTIVLDGNVYVKKQEPLTRHQISVGNQSMLNVTRDAFVMGVMFAEEFHGFGGGVCVVRNY